MSQLETRADGIVAAKQAVRQAMVTLIAINNRSVGYLVPRPINGGA